jgi:hypothetical protein
MSTQIFCGIVVNRDLSKVLLAETHLLFPTLDGREDRVFLDGVSSRVSDGTAARDALLRWNYLHMPWMRSRWMRAAVLRDESSGVVTFLYFAVADVVDLSEGQSQVGEGTTVSWRDASWVWSERSTNDLPLKFRIVQDAWRSIHDAPEGVGGSVFFREVSTIRLGPADAIVGSYERVSLLDVLSTGSPADEAGPPSGSST